MKNKLALLPRKEFELVYKIYLKGQIKEAINQIKILNEQYPNQPFLFNLIGVCYKEIGQLNGAVKMFKNAINFESKYAEAHYNLGATLQIIGQKNEAIESYKKAIQILPSYYDAHNNLGNILLEIGHIDLAIESLQWAIAYKHDFAEAHNNLGNALYEYGKVEKAIESYQKAIKYNSNYSKAYFNLALLFKDLGNKEDFIKNIEKSLSLNPHWGHAYYHLSRVKRFKLNDPQIDQMKLSIKNKNINSIDRIGLNFALSKAYEDIEDHDQQFKYLNEANSLRKKELNYSIDKDRKLFARIKEAFKFIPSIENIKASSSIRPIFVVGMPRSGTSLVHQIIDSHNEVHGVGELNNLNKFVIPLLKKYNIDDDEGFSQKDLLSVHNKYFKALPISGIEKKIIVDKMPLNFRHIGFILTSFPDAKIIHMNRDSMATCWSIYKYEFNGNAYSFDQKDIAIYYGLYKNLMQFWNNLFPDRIHEVSYENLTSNQEEETRKLLDYCDLNWDKNCLNFHTNKTAVKTTSSMQVRKKMYQGSSEVWKKYENYLQPLIKGLDYYKVDKNEFK
jgi:tetratricopeptide (TPR) repeat protein